LTSIVHIAGFENRQTNNEQFGHPRFDGERPGRSRWQADHKCPELAPLELQAGKQRKRQPTTNSHSHQEAATRARRLPELREAVHTEHQHPDSHQDGERERGCCPKPRRQLSLPDELVAVPARSAEKQENGDPAQVAESVCRGTGEEKCQQEHQCEQP